MIQAKAPFRALARPMSMLLLAALCFGLSACTHWFKTQNSNAQSRPRPNARSTTPLRPLVQAAAATCALAYADRLPSSAAHAHLTAHQALTRLLSPALDRWPNLSTRASITAAQLLIAPSPNAPPPRLVSPTPTPTRPTSPRQHPREAIEIASNDLNSLEIPVQHSHANDASPGLPLTLDHLSDLDPSQIQTADHALDIDLDPESATQISEVLKLLPSPTTDTTANTWVLRSPVKNPRITSGFGSRRDPFHPKERRIHKGTDFGGRTGDPVLAAGPGQVLFAGWGGKGTGKAVVIQHPGGITTQYFHLSRVDVQTNQTIQSGDTIGAIGATGRATGPHLHFQLNLSGNVVDPLLWIDRQMPPSP